LRLIRSSLRTALQRKLVSIASVVTPSRSPVEADAGAGERGEVESLHGSTSSGEQHGFKDRALVMSSDLLKDGSRFRIEALSTIGA
jgi:hypothetical protein